MGGRTRRGNAIRIVPLNLQWFSCLGIVCQGNWCGRTLSSERRRLRGVIGWGRGGELLGKDSKIRFKGGNWAVKGGDHKKFRPFLFFSLCLHFGIATLLIL